MSKVQSENVKLNGIIKTGKDALQAEQEVNKKLKEQLDVQSKVSIYYIIYCLYHNFILFQYML